MIRLVLIAALCIAGLSANNQCTVRKSVEYPWLKEVLCHQVILTKGQDLQTDQPLEANDEIVLKLAGVTGHIDKTSFASLRDKVKITTIVDSHFDRLVMPVMPKMMQINIEGNTLPIITEETFKNMENMKGILMENNTVDVKHGSFASAKHLKTILLVNQPYHHLLKVCLRGLEELEHFALMGCGVEYVDEDLFENTLEIRNLNLGNNKFTKIEPKTFQPLKKLQALSLLGTPLKEFPVDLLSEQGELTILALPANVLPNLDLDMLNKYSPKLQSIRVLDIEENCKQVHLFKEQALQHHITIETVPAAVYGGQKSC